MNWKRIIFGAVFLSVIATVIVLPHFAPHLAYARAGGGDAFDDSGDGGDLGSSLGGGFGGNSGFFFLPFLFNSGSGNSSWLIFVLFIFIFLVPYFLRRFGPNNGAGGGGFSGYGYGRRRGRWQQQQSQQTQQRPQDVEVALDTITKNDPGFNKERFVDYVETTFFSVQDAWTKKNLTSIRGLVTDAQYQRFLVQIQEMQRRGVTNVLDNIAIKDVKLVKVDRDQQYETIVTSLTASMIDYKTDDSTKKVVEGEPGTRNIFTEYWTFMRSSSAKTKNTEGLTAMKCPNCGAPLDITEAGECQYCKAHVVSGEFNWVLSNISQTLV